MEKQIEKVNTPLPHREGSGGGSVFDKLTHRRGTNSYKWDEAEEDDVIPMWVADMDFETAPCIVEALRKRVDHGIFGYTLVPESYYEAVINWFRRRHGWTIRREWIQYTSGVVPALSCVIKALTMPGERVLTLSPAYNCFFSSIRNNGCEVVEVPLYSLTPDPSRKERGVDSLPIENDDSQSNHSPLLARGAGGEAFWEIFEKQCADEKATLFVLCNPHNPTGRVWTRDELERMNDICLRHGVRVISDEIHCELTMPGYEYTPFAAVSQNCLDNSVTLNSPSKAFNIAGLQIANIVCSNAEWRRRIDRAININEVCDVNPFGVIALQAAYNEGEAWLDALRQYLYENYLALCEFLKEQLPQLRVGRLEATYLPWIDITATGLSSDALTDRLLSEGRVMVSSGTLYGRETGEGFIRLNIACPRERMMEGLRRIKSALTN